MDRCPKCNAECERSCDGDLIAATIDDNRLRNQLAAYRALLVDVHGMLARHASEQDAIPTGELIAMLTRIEQAVGKDGEER